MNVLSLFSGIGGIDLGLERAGMTTVGQVEIDPYCRAVLERHWPGVPRHDDVRTCIDWWRSRRRPTVDLLAAGFPCQPVSVVGPKRGVVDDRWLWPHAADAVRTLRPSWVLVENPPGLLRRGLDVVLGDLARLGYDSEWDCISASSVGAPHIRDRVFVVAHPHGGRRHGGTRDVWQTGRAEPPHRRRWPVEPPVGRVAHGIPSSVDRLRGLGNACVPQVAEYVGRLILTAAS